MGTVKLKWVRSVAPNHTGNGRARIKTRASTGSSHSLLLTVAKTTVRAVKMLITSFIKTSHRVLSCLSSWDAKRFCGNITHCPPFLQQVA